MNTAAGRIYPLADPSRQVPAGLVEDVAAALARHGFPALGDVEDFVELREALRLFMYGTNGLRRGI